MVASGGYPITDSNTRVIKPNPLTVLDLSNGRVLDRVLVGRGRPAVAVDSRARRVFVANSADGTMSVFSITA